MNEPKVSCKCPYCGVRLRVDPRKFRSEFRCPGCQQNVSLTKQSSDEASIPAALQESSGGMPVDGKEGDAWIQSALDSMLPPLSERTALTIGRFQIQRELGQGGFGKVYEAFDPLLKRTVALKVPTFGATSATRIRRFETEARSAARLHHPNIVAVYEHGETEHGQLYIASEFVKGKTVRELVENAAESVPLRRRVQWIHDLADALAYAHAENIIHRDIKPENILVSDANDRAKLVDFGLAKVNDPSDAAGDNQARTQDGLLGTPAFMSPEQAKGTISQVGPASDQYSLGAALYQCLTGVPPYRGSVFVIVAAVAGHERPTAIESLCPRIPGDLVAICNKAMSKEINDRYESCRELRDDLKAWLNDQPVSARRPSVLRQAGRFIRQHPWPTGLTCVSLTLLGMLAFTMSTAYSRADRDRTEIDRQRLSAEAETRRAEELIVQLRGANGEIEQARKVAVESQRSAESALVNLQRQIALTTVAESERNNAVTQAAAAEKAAVTASLKAENTKYASRMEDAAGFMARGMPLSAINILPSVSDDESMIELRYLRGCVYPLIASLKCPSPNASTQISADATCRTVVVREAGGTIWHAAVELSVEGPQPKWTSVTGLPNGPMALTPSGRFLFYCSFMPPRDQLTMGIRPSGSINPLFGADFFLPEVGQSHDSSSMKWQLLHGDTTFSSGIIARNESGKRVLLQETLSSGLFELSESCSRNDWNALLALEIDNNAHHVQYARGLGESQRKSEIRKEDIATFATLCPGTNSMLVTYANGQADIVDVLNRESKITHTFACFNEKQEEVLGASFVPKKRDIAIYTKAAVQIIHKGGTKIGPELRIASGDDVSSASFASSGDVILTHVLSRDSPSESRVLAFDATCLDGKALGVPYVNSPKLQGVIHASLSGDCSLAVLVKSDELQIVSVTSGELVSSLPFSGRHLIAAYFCEENNVLAISKHSARIVDWKAKLVSREYDLNGILAKEGSTEIESATWIPEQRALAITHGRGDPQRTGLNPRISTTQISFGFIRLDSPHQSQSWDLRPGLAGGKPASVLACSQDGQLLVVRPRDTNLIELRRSITSLDGIVLNGAQDNVTTAGITPDSTRVLTGHMDGSIKFWDAVTGDALLSTQPSSSAVRTISISADSRKAIVTYADGAVQLIGDVYLSDAGPSAGK